MNPTSSFNPKNIVIRMPNWLGDGVMATPLVEDVKKKWPQASITLMAPSHIAPLFMQNPYVDDVYAYYRPSGWLHGQRAVWDIIKTLRQGEYDLGILTTNSFSSAWWFWRAGIPQRIGFKMRGRGWLLSHPVPVPSEVEKQHQVFTYKMLLASLGIPCSATTPRLYLAPEEIEEAKMWLKNLGIYEGSIVIGINPGAAYGSAKCWLPERFREVTKKLLQNPLARVIYFGDQATAGLVNKICEGLSERVINLAGKTSLRELMALIKLSSVFLTNDSGPMHIAAAFSTPLVALFGSTSDIKTPPYKTGTVIRKNVHCSPCYQRVCPTDFRCMKQIEVEEVYQALQKYIQSSGY